VVLVGFFRTIGAAGGDKKEGKTELIKKLEEGMDGGGRARSRQHPGLFNDGIGDLGGHNNCVGAIWDKRRGVRLKAQVEMWTTEGGARLLDHPSVHGGAA